MEKKTDEKEENVEIMNEFDTPKQSMFATKLLPVLAVAIVLGVITGYALAQKGGTSFLGTTTSGVSNVSGGIAKGTVEGSEDTKTFKDVTEGSLEQGGIDGEGQYHLIRPGGESQTVYLTSSIVDLSKYLKRKIKVWGQTQKAKKAGWLMDVGRVEVLD